MLELRNVCKSYTTADFTQVALDHVSVAFRDNEFVAILGPSGSGKTTMLNIIGGLDHYDSGDLLVDGISTKKYKDRDWDAYRNNRIGFVFQSYNLIPHQTILENVELALTLSGVSRKERRQRAKEALEKVGLGEHINKKPSQLSGGQMQRVAIARALINDPEILLADEPTGALDSKTSVQIMDLLEEIADDRLVIMVTHNPDLAEQYATRIVNLTDGVITGDTNPFDPYREGVALRAAKPARKTHMSWFTALSLSFRNLMTKKGRTFMTAFAGSIGIIGIAAILALANGVNSYIADIEEETLSEYPLSITSQGFDMTSLLTDSTSAAEEDDDEETSLRDSILATFTSDDEEEDEDSNVISEVKIITSMFGSIESNDLASLKEYLDSGESGIEEYVNAIEYTYDITPQIYSSDTSEGVHQVNPDTTFSSLGLSSTSTTSSLISSYTSTDIFDLLPSESSLYEDQYDIVAGRWPESYDEIVLVLTSGGSVSDFMMYAMGLRDYDELEDMVQQFVEGEEVEDSSEYLEFTYDDILDITFKLVNACDYYEYDEEYDVWTDKTDDEDYMIELVENGVTLHIVGIVQPNEDATVTSLSAGLYYTQDLVEYIVEQASESEIVQQQLDDPSIDVFTGEAFVDDDDDSDDDSSFTIESLFTIDEEKISAAFTIDEDALTEGLSDLDLDLSDISIDTSSLGSFDTSSISIDTSSIDLSGITLDLSGIEITIDGVEPTIDYDALASAISIDSDALTSAVSSSINADTITSAITSSISSIDSTTLSSAIVNSIDTEAVISSMTSIMEDFFDSEYYSQYGTSLLSGGDYTLEQAMSDYLSSDSVKSSLSSSIAGAIDTSSVASAIAGAIDSTIISSAIADAIDSTALSSAVSSAITIDSTALASAIDTSSMMDEIASQVESQVESQVSSVVTEQLVPQIVSSLSSQIMSQLSTQISTAVQSYLESALSTAMEEMSASLEEQINEAMESYTSQLSENMANAISIDEEAFADAFSTTMTEEELTELLMALFSTDEASYADNLATLGYADFDDPTAIDIYPTDFESKEEVTRILDEYNDALVEAGEEDSVVTYTDVVGSLMSSVTTIVNMISYVLTAFVSISLVVSSIMIGIITYISVLERKKEIGILRSIGASKGDVANVFNAETIIVGLCAGIIGIVITILASLIVNPIMYNMYGVPQVMKLPWQAAIGLILLSTFLTFLSGLIPSSAASRKDPVEALRSE